MGHRRGERHVAGLGVALRVRASCRHAEDGGDRGERRDDLARTLSLDQGKPQPLRAEAHDEVEELIAYFEMASADATRMEGLIPPSVDAGKRVFVYRVPRGVVGVISPWNWPFTMPGELLARPVLH